MVVNSRRNAGRSWPQPIRISETISWACSRAEGEGSRISLPRAYVAVQDEVADALGMQRGKADRERAAVGHPEQRDPLETGRRR